MVEQLFGSKTRVKLLQLFYGNPNRSFYVREITRKIDEQINSVRRELANLLSIGIIASDTNNNRLYYEVSQDYDYYQPLSVIFGGTPAKAMPKKSATKSKITTETIAKENPQTQEIKAIGNIELALFTGQFTRDETSGIDLLIVGDVNQTKLAKYIDDLEEKEGKEIRYTVIPKREFDYRKQVKDRFLSNIITSKKQVLIDKHELLTQVLVQEAN
ncbi:MAG: transcriptional regulator [Minisyncoccia bacterium]